MGIYYYVSMKNIENLDEILISHYYTRTGDMITISSSDIDITKLEDDIIIYSRHLCSLASQHLDEMDTLIKKHSKNWNFERITIIDRLILRMSLAEMLFEDEVPPKVSITEGVEIAKQFSTSDSSSFINGIMDAVYNDLVKGKEKAA